MEISERDEKLLNATQMSKMTWKESKQVAQKGDLTLFRRSPQQIQRYLEAKEYFKQTCGDTATFILRNKLKWENDLKSDAQFLENANDVKILVNDYPYYFVDGIEHLVVWSKVRCQCDPETEQPTEVYKNKIDDFIAKTFAPLGISGDNIMWFKNTVSLQSVPTLEHFHILLRKDGWQPVVGTAGYLSGTLDGPD